MHRRAYWDGHGLFCEADYHERFPKSPTQTSGSFTCHKCWASQPVGKKYIERTSVNDLRVLRCQKCDDGTIIAARVHGRWATFTSIMARSDREGLCEVPFYSNLDRVALELLRPGLAPTQSTQSQPRAGHLPHKPGRRPGRARRKRVTRRRGPVL